MSKEYVLSSTKQTVLFVLGFLLIAGGIVASIYSESNFPLIGIPISVAFFVAGFRVQKPRAVFEKGVISHFEKGRLIAEYDLNGVSKWNLNVQLAKNDFESRRRSHGSKLRFIDASIDCENAAGMKAEFSYSDNQELFGVLLIYLSPFKPKSELKELADAHPMFEAHDKLIGKIFSSWRADQ